MSDFKYCDVCGDVMVDEDITYYDMCEECGNEFELPQKEENEK